MTVLGRMTVLPRLPEAIEALEGLARNLAWTWDQDCRALFRELDVELWERVNHNPLALLRDVAQERLDAVSNDAGYVARLAAAASRIADDARTPRWFQREVGADHLYAYFCAEYGWHEAVALYSGGLGILAADHTKAASDLGVPLVGVGLWYPEGYFHQRVGADGRQEAVYERYSVRDLPLVRVMGSGGDTVRVHLRVFGRDVAIGAWRVDVGRVPVYLLDVDLPENHPDDRALLARLYGGDQRTRIAQEMILGIGGVRMLRALGIAPTSWHMNEGHSAFMALERCREHVEAGVAFDQARELVSSSTLFTVHTPVAAGNDAFPFDLVAQAFAGDWHPLGLRQHEFLDLGRFDHGWGPVFSMPALALRFTSGRNGVARLHGDTSRRLWSPLWPGVPIDEIPIGHVTNGVHTGTWVSNQIRTLVAGVLPDDWRQRLDDAEMWRPVESLPPADLWRVRRAIKRDSIAFLRRRVSRQLSRQQASPNAIVEVADLFDVDALTIGFARRFATYKRATLFMRDLERLHRILAHPERPVQFVFAGKAHPADQAGQEFIRQIHTLSSDPRFHGRVLFLEDYDMAVGRALTRGVDVWLNNPRRPLEASGTSGQKAAMNGVLNLSILDGWWPEGFDGMNGWAMGGDLVYDDEQRGDEADAEALYALLEREVIPLYYDRDADGVPVEWVRRSARAIATVTPRFNAQRMVKDYVRAYYAPASERGRRLVQGERAADLAAWRKRVRDHWSTVYFQGEQIIDGVRRIGDDVLVEAVFHPRELRDAGVRVELVYGPERHELQHELRTVAMEQVEVYDDGARRYRARFRPELSGRLVYGVRAYPTHPDLADPFDAGALRWG